MNAIPTISQYKKKAPEPDRLSGGCRILGRPKQLTDERSPLVSVITVVRNGGQALERTILSVLGQSYSNLEYIVIDGKSTDGTLDIIRRYEDRIAYWLSEPDAGISDAFNKGIAAASGEYIGLLNADDWLSPDQIECGIKAMRASSTDFVFGDLLFHDEDGRILYRINGDAGYTRIIHSKMPELCHPTVLTWKRVYDRIGLFDTNYRYAMDYEWFLRLHVGGGKGMYVKNIVGHMGIGGASDRSFLKAVKEVRDISVRYGQNRLKAEALYQYRMLKGTGRRYLERTIPRKIFDRIRTLFNPRYSSIK